MGDDDTIDQAGPVAGTVDTICTDCADTHLTLTYHRQQTDWVRVGPGFRPDGWDVDSEMALAALQGSMSLVLAHRFMARALQDLNRHPFTISEILDLADNWFASSNAGPLPIFESIPDFLADVIVEDVALAARLINFGRTDYTLDAVTYITILDRWPEHAATIADVGNYPSSIIGHLTDRLNSHPPKDWHHLTVDQQHTRLQVAARDTPTSVLAAVVVDDTVDAESRQRAFMHPNFGVDAKKTALEKLDGTGHELASRIASYKAWTYGDIPKREASTWLVSLLDNPGRLGIKTLTDMLAVVDVEPSVLFANNNLWRHVASLSPKHQLRFVKAFVRYGTARTDRGKFRWPPSPSAARPFEHALWQRSRYQQFYGIIAQLAEYATLSISVPVREPLDPDSVDPRLGQLIVDALEQTDKAGDWVDWTFDTIDLATRPTPPTVEELETVTSQSGWDHGPGSTARIRLVDHMMTLSTLV